jgi:multicomponent Na+:H+ antiporter subunit D
VKPETSIQLAMALPLLAIVLTVVFGQWPNVRESLTLLLAGTVFVVVACMAQGVFAGGRPGVSWLEVVPGLKLAFELEPLGMLFALVASGLWIVTTCYSIGYMRAHNESHQTRFYAFFAMAIFAALGAAMAQNMFTLFIFYEVLTLSTYPLVTHHGDEKARRGGRIYLGILLFTSIAFLLLAVTWTWVIAGTLDFKPGGVLAGRADDRLLFVLLMLYAFGTGKAALMPFHRWLPAAMVAPTPVSALLHAVAVVKVGVFTILKVSVYIFGIDLLNTSRISVPLMYLAGTTVLVASLVALTRDNLKARLAYSTISQLSYIILGAALANSWGVIGGGMHIVMHAFGKITLFFCAGAIYVTTHKTEISEMRGIGRTMPITTSAFLLGSLSVIGLPPFGGSWSKWFLALGAAEGHHTLLVATLMISSLLNIAYLMPIVVRGFFLAPTDGPDRPAIKEAPIFCVLSLCFTAAGGFVLFLFADRVYQVLVPITLHSL